MAQVPARDASIYLGTYYLLPRGILQRGKGSLIEREGWSGRRRRSRRSKARVVVPPLLR